MVPSYDAAHSLVDSSINCTSVSLYFGGSPPSVARTLKLQKMASGTCGVKRYYILDFILDTILYTIYYIPYVQSEKKDGAIRR